MALRGQAFDAVVVTNYLYRARLPLVFRLLEPGGVLLYETFMLGNERFGKPSNPDFLLMPGELPQRLGDGRTVVAFEQGETPGAETCGRAAHLRRQGERSACGLALMRGELALGGQDAAGQRGDPAR